MTLISNTIDFLASNIDCVELPSLSGDEVWHELEICPAQWYTDETGFAFYTNMVNQFNAESATQRIEIRQPKKLTRSGKPMRKGRKSDPISKPVSKEQLEEFRLELKSHRIRLGLTQSEAAKSIAKVTNRPTSQTSLCRFENNQLHLKNMNNLYPFFKQWISEVKP